MNSNRIQRLRLLLKERSLGGVIIPSFDQHRGDDAGSHFRRLAFISGFTGSSGISFVLESGKAALFVDGRYIIQARLEVNPEIFEIFLLEKKNPFDWIASVMKSGDSLGFDPWLLSGKEFESYSTMAKKMMINLVQTENLVDCIWEERPPSSRNPVRIYPIKYAGSSIREKIERVSSFLKKYECDACLVTTSDSVNWLLNIRGGDLDYTPVALSFAIVYQNRTVDFFIDLLKIRKNVRNYLVKSDVVIFPYESFLDRVRSLARERIVILSDFLTVPYLINKTIKTLGGTIFYHVDPISLFKMCKNKEEIRGMKRAQLFDGIAFSNFLSWLQKERTKKNVDELTAVNRLEFFRERQGSYRGPSFATIVGSGPNGAVVHYRASSKTNRVLEENDIILIDAGGQYDGGCTDVSRTISFGKPTSEQRDIFTRVLKGHIALLTTFFPTKTIGSSLDVLARQYLWQIKSDYNHGTGHGVGAALAVHEGPCGITRFNSTELKSGMILSNEPGFYLEGSYGMRIENLVVVIEADSLLNLIQGTWLKLKAITLVPIELKLIDISMLDRIEKLWLNSYHKSVRKKLMPFVLPETREWLERATSPV